MYPHALVRSHSHSFIHSFILPSSHPSRKHLRTYCVMLVAKPTMGPLLLGTLSKSPLKLDEQSPMEICLSLHPTGPQAYPPFLTFTPCPHSLISL